MADDDTQRPRQPAPPPIEFVRPGEEQPTGQPSSGQPPAAWVPRPEDYLQATRPPQAARPQGAAGPLHLYAGIALLIAGIIGMGDTIYYAVQFLSPAAYQSIYQNITLEIYVTSQICGLVAIWGQVAAFLGGIMAIQRMNWKLAAACAIFSLVSIGGAAVLFGEPGLGVAGAVAFFGLILAFRSRHEFLS